MAQRQSSIPPEVYEQLLSIPPASLLDVLSPQGYTKLFMRGVRCYTPGQKLIGRAVTLRLVPTRPDMKEETYLRPGIGSRRSEAMELCGPGDVLVIDAMGHADMTVGGDIKFLRLQRRGAEGVVTDGALRDTAGLLTYGLKLYAAGTSGNDGDLDLLPWGINEVVACGGVAVRPGDYIVGDDDGVVVVPQQMIHEAIKQAHTHLRMEEAVKRHLQVEDAPVGKYYPWKEATAEILKD